MQAGQQGKKLRVLLLGQGLELCRMAQWLTSHGHQVAGILTYPREEHQSNDDEHRIEKREGLYADIFVEAEKLSLEIHESANFNEPGVLQWVRDRQPDLAISWRTRSILKRPFLDLFAGRIFNIHIGHLPHYQGSGAMSWMILNGATGTAVVFHRMTPKIDQGEMVGYFPFPVPPQAYPIDIYREASRLILENFTRLLDPDIKPVHPENEEIPLKTSYFPRLKTMVHGVIDWAWSPGEIERFIRAFGYPYAGAFALRDGERVHLARAEVVEVSPEKGFHPFCQGLVLAADPPTGSVVVVAGTGLLRIHTVRDGIDEIPATRRLRPGQRLMKA